MVTHKYQQQSSQSTAPLKIRVAVGSTNPCKIEAVRKAFEDVFVMRNSNGATISVQIVISSYNVPSGKIKLSA
eukprot:CAMPEP_0172316410 /NCGR_PEP_ID=MMETSP1058-20130122/28089_1 /TAXON_ID=83371 /ORGANISM="Detonula confervacea, Strain CCMP 353" /LENGTH=72 /DNA_ID=CAMNT_0013030711 /DNA_START=10 /DNA_END=224 /DNA_ORIENTATION=+